MSDEVPVAGVSEKELGNPECRKAAWEHAMAVITTPAFAPMGYMVHHCQIIERLLMDYKSQARQHRGGSMAFTAMALSHYWILGFYEILRIIRDRKYRKQAEFPFDEDLSSIFEKTENVRITFAKLEVPKNQKTNIMPSYSGIYGPVIFSVYNKDGEQTSVNRRQLADEFLMFMGQCQKSYQYEQWLKHIEAVGDRKGCWDRDEDGPTDHEMLEWQIAGSIANKDLWGLNSSKYQNLPKELDQDWKKYLLKKFRT